MQLVQLVQLGHFHDLDVGMLSLVKWMAIATASLVPETMIGVRVSGGVELLNFFHKP